VDQTIIKPIESLSKTHIAKLTYVYKDSDAGRDWGQEENGTTKEEMAGWHHWLDRRESEWTLGVGDGQGGLACCHSWGHKDSDKTDWLNWTELILSNYGLYKKYDIKKCDKGIKL